MRKIFFFFIMLTILNPPNSFSQVEDLELESPEDLSILDEFESDDIEISETDEEEEMDSNFTDTDLLEDGELSENDSKEEIAEEESPEEKEDDLELDEDLLQEDELMAEEKAIENSEKKESLILGLDESVDDDDLFADDDELTSNPLDDVEISRTNDISELQDYNRKIDDAIIGEFSRKSQESVEEVIQDVARVNNTRYTTFEMNALKVQLKDISKSPLRVYQLVKGTQIIRIKDNKSLYTPKTLTVRAHTLNDFYKNKYIINNKGKITYKVSYKKIADIATISNLYRAPYEFKRLPKKKKKNVYEKNFNYDLNFSLHTGLTTPSYTDSLLSKLEGYAPTLRLESSFISNRKKYVDTGVTFVYESVSGNFKSSGNYNIKSYSIGPTFRSTPGWNSFSFIVQPRVSFFSVLDINIGDQNSTIDLAQTALLLGMEQDYKYKNFGTLTLGFNYQRRWIQANPSNVLVEVGNHVSYDDTIAFFIGHKSGWLW